MLAYLGRYTHRIAIANHRILDLYEGLVSFRWRDYADANRPKIMTLTVAEFVRRFGLHVIPTGCMRIRHQIPPDPFHLQPIETLDTA